VEQNNKWSDANLLEFTGTKVGRRNWRLSWAAKLIVLGVIHPDPHQGTRKRDDLGLISRPSGATSAPLERNVILDQHLRQRRFTIFGMGGSLTGTKTPLEMEAADEHAPVQGRAALNLTWTLLHAVLSDEVLSPESVNRTTAVHLHEMPPGEQSLADIDTRLSEVAIQFQTYLIDIHAHLNFVQLLKAEMREDFARVSELMSDVLTIQQRLIAMQFEIVEFHKTHSEELTAGAKNPPSANSEELPGAGNNAPTQQDFMRKIVISGHQSWLNYQVAYIKAAMRSVIRLYKIATEEQKR
jgi:hypothetical protein